MTKTELSKAVVNNMVGLIVGGVVSNFIKAYRPRWNNPILDAVAGLSGFVTGWVVGAMIHDKIRPSAEQQVDDFIAKIRLLVKN